MDSGWFSTRLPAKPRCVVEMSVAYSDSISGADSHQAG